MNYRLEVNKQLKCPFSEKYFEKVVSKTLKVSGVKNKTKLDISLAVVSEREIRKINRIYRKKDRVTDVISFSDYCVEKKSKSKEFFCELIICYPYIKRSAAEDRIKISKEMAYVISHGVLHIIGFRHSKKMYEIQDKVAENF